MRAKWLRCLCLSLIFLLPVLAVFAQGSPTINVSALLHDSRADLYRTPGGAAPFDTTVTLRLRAAAGDLDSASVRLWNTRKEAQSVAPMQVAATTPDGYDYWEASLDVGDQPTVWWYRFIVSKGGETLYYEDDTRPGSGSYRLHREGGPGAVYAESPDLSYQITVYDPAYYTPEWMRSATIYQIFPDRFRNGDPSNDPADGAETFYGDIPLYFHETWNERMLDGRVDLLPSGAGYWNSDFYGGDLAGIIEKLDYLQSLGVTAIYLNPIFLARSNHRYDTADFLQIDPYLGTLDDFRSLVAAAEERGIKLILDGVFNHMSSDSEIFDRYNRFEGENGACESLESPYRSWFYFAPPRANQPAPCAGDPDPLYYVSWFGFDSIPKINNTIIETRRYFFLDPGSVARTWGAEGIGGWRLDVAGDIDNGRDPNNIFWEAFRTVVRQVNPETVIIGEEWWDAAEWMNGDEWDSTMNYRLRTGILGFVRDTDFTDNDANGDRIIYAITPSELDATIRAIEEDYPRMGYLALMNLLGSHDVTRLFFAVGNDPQRQMLAAITQFSLPGAPTVYYGDEIALDAPSIADSGGVLQDDPYNRAPYPWADTSGDTYPPPNESILAYYQQLGALRQNNPALRQGEMLTLATDDAAGIYAFLRLDRAAGNVALVALNNSDQEQTALVNYAGLLPRGLTLEPAFGGEPISTDTLAASVRIPANSGNIWTFTGSPEAFALLAAPANVAAAPADGAVTVTWEPVEGAAGYIVYRSPVATGGYEPLSGIPVSGQSYTDTSVVNGFVYHYAVAPVSGQAVIGTTSAGVMATPSYPISAAFYVGDFAEPRTLGLVFGVTTELQAAIRIDGVTEADGPVPGVRAEAALIPAEGEAAEWLPMAYSGEQDGADLYRITFAPQAVGEYRMTARFSADAGQTWTTAALDDGSAPLLVVEASDDTAPPPAPATVTISRASLSGVSLTWEPVEDSSLFAYRVYRTDATGTTQIAELPAADGTAYTDTSVAEGATYTYSITAVDGSLNESEPTRSEAVTVQRLLVRVTFVATVPDYTNSAVYIAGSFGSRSYPTWDPAGLAMTQVDDTHWTITLELVEGAAIEYKYVRGDWAAVEKGSECEEIANRRATIAPDAEGAQRIDDTVAKWRDLDGCG